MRGLLTLIFMLRRGIALAHPGHWAEVAGHDHWIAGAAIGAGWSGGTLGCVQGQKSEEKMTSKQKTKSWKRKPHENRCDDLRPRLPQPGGGR